MNSFPPGELVAVKLFWPIVALGTVARNCFLVRGTIWFCGNQLFSNECVNPTSPSVPFGHSRLCGLR